MRGMEAVTQKMLTGESGVKGYEFNGTKKICGFAPVKLTGWSLAYYSG